MSEPNPHKVIEELVQLHARQIGEHVDSVQIFVTQHSDGGETTKAYNFGVGNWYSRMSQVREWVIAQDEYVREEARISQRRELE